MLQLKEISKRYITGDLHQVALDSVSLNLRDNEFVAILGPSGSGKTTLLNIIGGLDRYDSGDLIINNISTKKYKDHDWDSYRNHTIGFVFQSYNLIPHQSILSNVELALTISGVSRKERKERARKALEEVGLGNQLHKKPNQMSGGQMQRVAIARALVNNPDILLADEPTGALDTETSVQVMELLKEVAKDRLVVMVTHNPELAQQYATRIVNLRDGKIINDSDPYVVDDSQLEAPKYKNMGKSSMSFATALLLSFNNLRTKKARTFLTSFAGSIGIIGIALILALSTGVNNYIIDIQKSTMTSYPITIDAQTIDLSSMIGMGGTHGTSNQEVQHGLDGVYSNGIAFEMVSMVQTSITENNLTEFKKYLDNPESEIHQYIGENGIVYSYNVKFDVYTHDPEGVFVNTNGSTLGGMMQNRANHFSEMLPESALANSYDVVYGTWPKAYDEVILVLDKNNEIQAATLYQLGLLPTSEYKELIEKIENGEQVKLETQYWSYEEICNKEFYLIPECDLYKEQESGLFSYIGDDVSEMEQLMKEAMQLKIVGVVRLAEDAENYVLRSTIGYTKALTDYIIEYTKESPVVKAQQEEKDKNILNGFQFAPEDDAVKIKDAKNYLTNLGVTDKAKMYRAMMQSMAPQMLEQMSSLTEMQMAMAFDQYLTKMTDDMLISIYDTYISPGTYEDNMEDFGLVSVDAPVSIHLYADSFEDKDTIAECIKDYNKTAKEENKIVYTDYVGLLMSSVTTIVNVISYVLIAFVSVSLVVSSIMIGIITYISVLERTKEIGILRAIGASKHNIAQVFNAETFIIGLGAGLIGIGTTLLLLIPANGIIHVIADNTNVNAQLPVSSAVILIGLSVILTLIGGLIPSKKAAKKDPVTALRTE